MTAMATPMIGWPEGALDLLARAALAPKADALNAWRDWRRDHDIDTTPWGEVRMLGTLAARIEWLEPDASIKPRIMGIRKFLWVQSQICLKNIDDALRALKAAQVPVMLLKGAARVAYRPAALQERLIRDVDILVPLDKAHTGFEALVAEGWSLVDDGWQPGLRVDDPISAHHAWALRKGRSELDLHHFSNFLNRLSGDDDNLWRRARPIEWKGSEVFIPSPADGLLIALTHGIRWSQDKAADWTVDACALIDEGEIDWPILLEECRARLLQAVLLPGLIYLRDVLARRVPDFIVTALSRELSPLQKDEFGSYATEVIPKSPQEITQAAHMGLRRALREKNPAESKPEVARQFKGKLRGTLSRGKAAVLSIDTQSIPEDWIEFQVTVRVPGFLPGHSIRVLCGIPGLSLDFASCTILAQTDGEPYAYFKIDLPKVLLARRLARTIHFAVHPQQPAELPDEIDIEVKVFGLH